MDAELTAEQQELRRAVRDLGVDRSTGAHVRAAMAGPTGHDPELWRLVAGELGLPGVGVADTYGGSGGSFVDVAVVVEEAGRCLLPVPLLPTYAAAAALEPVAAESAPAAQALGALAGGAVGTLAVGDVAVEGEVATGELRHVIDAGVADQLVVAAGSGLFVVDPAVTGVAVEPRPTLDPTRRQATVRLDRSPVRRVGDAAAAARAVDVLRVLLAVETVGVMRWCLTTTVDYLKTRVQFDRPIGSFQALQHRAADLVVEVEAAASAAAYAAWAVAAAPDEVPVVAPLALSVAGDAAEHVAAETIQLHGGIGFTWEHDAHLYFKRATASRLLLGDPVVQRRLVAARAGLVP